LPKIARKFWEISTKKAGPITWDRLSFRFFLPLQPHSEGGCPPTAGACGRWDDRDFPGQPPGTWPVSSRKKAGAASRDRPLGQGLPKGLVLRGNLSGPVEKGKPGHIFLAVAPLAVHQGLRLIAAQVQP